MIMGLQNNDIKMIDKYVKQSEINEKIIQPFLEENNLCVAF